MIFRKKFDDNSKIIFRYGFRDKYNYMVFVSYLFILLLVVIILPDSLLRTFSWPSFVFSLSKRNINDYEFLVSHRPEFSDAYIGGLVIQIFLSLIIFFIHTGIAM